MREEVEGVDECGGVVGVREESECEEGVDVMWCECRCEEGVEIQIKHPEGQHFSQCVMTSIHVLHTTTHM